MSLPRKVPSYSSSPSKSSLRQTSGPQSSSRNPTLLPSPHFDDEHLADYDHGSPQDNQQASYDEHAVESSIQNAPLNFQPFFTLIEDPVTHEHYHPTVHYIFADDDTEIITDASCRSIEENEDSGSQAAVSGLVKEQESRYLPPPAPAVREHYLVLDVRSTPTTALEHAADPTLEVSQAHSLSSEWQVLRTSITQAPTIGDSKEDEGLMLRIEGRGNTPPDAMGKEREKESLEEMIERFQKRLEDVRLVMEGGKEG